MKYLAIICSFFLLASMALAQPTTSAAIQKIYTDKAPKPIGTYSQAIKANNMVYISGQIGISPETNELISPEFTAQARQVFANISSICHASGAQLNQVVKLTIYLTDLGNFPEVNKIMAENFKEPYPARVTVQISKLPKDAKIEVDAIVNVE